MLVMLRLVFFGSEDSFSHDVGGGVVFLSEALWNSEV